MVCFYKIFLFLKNIGSHLSFLSNHTAILYRLARGSGHVVNGDKDIVYTHKDLLV